MSFEGGGGPRKRRRSKNHNKDENGNCSTSSGTINNSNSLAPDTTGKSSRRQVIAFHPSIFNVRGGILKYIEVTWDTMDAVPLKHLVFGHQQVSVYEVENKSIFDAKMLSVGTYHVDGVVFQVIDNNNDTSLEAHMRDIMAPASVHHTSSDDPVDSGAQHSGTPQHSSQRQRSAKFDFDCSLASDAEAVQIDELKQSIGSALHAEPHVNYPEVVGDIYMLRLLRGNKYDVQAAAEVSCLSPCY